MSYLDRVVGKIFATTTASALLIAGLTTFPASASETEINPNRGRVIDCPTNSEEETSGTAENPYICEFEVNEPVRGLSPDQVNVLFREHTPPFPLSQRWALPHAKFLEELPKGLEHSVSSGNFPAGYSGQNLLLKGTPTEVANKTYPFQPANSNGETLGDPLYVKIDVHDFKYVLESAITEPIELGFDAALSDKKLIDTAEITASMLPRGTTNETVRINIPERITVINNGNIKQENGEYEVVFGITNSSVQKTVKFKINDLVVPTDNLEVGMMPGELYEAKPIAGFRGVETVAVQVANTALEPHLTIPTYSIENGILNFSLHLNPDTPNELLVLDEKVIFTVQNRFGKTEEFIVSVNLFDPIDVPLPEINLGRQTINNLRFTSVIEGVSVRSQLVSNTTQLTIGGVPAAEYESLPAGLSFVNFDNVWYLSGALEESVEETFFVVEGVQACNLGVRCLEFAFLVQVKSFFSDNNLVTDLGGSVEGFSEYIGYSPWNDRIEVKFEVAGEAPAGGEFVVEEKQLKIVNVEEDATFDTPGAYPFTLTASYEDTDTGRSFSFVSDEFNLVVGGTIYATSKQTSLVGFELGQPKNILNLKDIVLIHGVNRSLVNTDRFEQIKNRDTRLDAVLEVAEEQLFLTIKNNPAGRESLFFKVFDAEGTVVGILFFEVVPKSDIDFPGDAERMFDPNVAEKGMFGERVQFGLYDNVDEVSVSSVNKIDPETGNKTLVDIGEDLNLRIVPANYGFVLGGVSVAQPGTYEISLVATRDYIKLPVETLTFVSENIFGEAENNVVKFLDDFGSGFKQNVGLQTGFSERLSNSGVLVLAARGLSSQILLDKQGDDWVFVRNENQVAANAVGNFELYGWLEVPDVRNLGSTRSVQVVDDKTSTYGLFDSVVDLNFENKNFIANASSFVTSFDPQFSSGETFSNTNFGSDAVRSQFAFQSEMLQGENFGEVVYNPESDRFVLNLADPQNFLEESDLSFVFVYGTEGEHSFSLTKEELGLDLRAVAVVNPEFSPTNLPPGVLEEDVYVGQNDFLSLEVLELLDNSSVSSITSNFGLNFAVVEKDGQTVFQVSGSNNSDEDSFMTFSATIEGKPVVWFVSFTDMFNSAS